jgi:hypothetical protein
MAGIIGALATRGTHLVAPLVIHTVDLFEPQELLEFFGFLGMLAHRLRVGGLRGIHCWHVKLIWHLPSL